MEISFTVPGQPIGKARPRFSLRSGCVYTPAKTRNAERDIKVAAYKVRPAKPILGAVTVEIRLFYEVPKSWSLKKKAAALAGKIRPIVKPDIDNCSKIILDALNKTIWKDDSQVVQLMVEKWYSSQPAMTVRVREHILPF